jgi:hypothetical protein
MQQLGLVTKPSAEAGLHFGGIDKELKTAWLIWHSACAILLLSSASTLGSVMMAVHYTMKVMTRSRSGEIQVLVLRLSD